MSDPNRVNLGTLLKQKLNSPEKWTKEAFARDSKGQSVQWQSGEATCYCLMGALQACKQEVRCIRVSQMTQALYKFLDNNPKFDTISSRSIMMFNDLPNTTFEDIQQFLNVMEETEAKYLETLSKLEE